MADREETQPLISDAERHPPRLRGSGKQTDPDATHPDEAKEAESIKAPSGPGFMDTVMPKLLAEFIGTFFLVLTVSLSVTLQMPLAALAIGAVFSVFMFALADISLAHFNPAITFGAFLCKKIEWKEGLMYVSSQILGALGGALVGFAVHGRTPSPSVGVAFTTFGAVVMETVFTFALVFIALSLGHMKHPMQSWCVGMTVFVGAVACGDVSGAALNPALATGLSFVDGVNKGKGLNNLWLYWLTGLLGSTLSAVALYVLRRDMFPPTKKAVEKE